MNITPTNQDIEDAADLLLEKYKMTPAQINRFFGNDKEFLNETKELIKSILKLKQNMNDKESLKLLLRKEGSELLCGGSEDIRNLRKFLLEKVDSSTIIALYRKHEKDGKLNAANWMIKPLSEKRWHSGKKWAKDFVKAVGLPEIFAGAKAGIDFNRSTIQLVPPFIGIPSLEPFQKGLKKNMLQILKNDGDKTRCVISLPTGGGKTRVAVDAFIDWMRPRFSEKKYLLWIAQSEELCEQAISCVDQLWRNTPFTETLRIYRFFGGSHIKNEDDLDGGVVVCSIQKLYSGIKKEENLILDEILENAGAIIIDECHRAVSMMYNKFFDRIEEIRGKDNVPPICGLSATPGRAGIGKTEQIQHLVDRFHCNLIEPDLGGQYKDDPLEYFRKEKYLSKARHFIYKSGVEYELTDKEISESVDGSDEKIGPTFLKRLSKDKKRNRLIIDKLRSIDKKSPTIVFSCTVEHAEYLSMIMTALDRPSGVISSDTSLTVRRGLIQDFRDGRLDFLFNFGVLTTGFDSPKIQNVVICRPTTSVILYEQIVGRGVRGPKFGGTEECTIIDFADNINRLGRPLAYARFKDYWTTPSDNEPEEIEENFS